jgi:two-component system cell cycle sensor histidine kinase/response regulator CckA
MASQLTNDTGPNAARPAEVFRPLVDDAPSVLVQTDLHGNWLWVNRRWTEWTGYPNEDCLGAGWLKAIHPDDLERARALRTRSTGTDLTMPFRVVSRLGSSRFVLAHSAPLTDDHGRPIGYALSFTDVTALEKRRDAIRDRERAAEHSVNQRELEDLRRQLEQTRRFESLGRLAGGVAHDFNNLLGVVLNYAVLIGRSTEISDQTRQDLAHVERAAKRGADLTRQLLLFSRREQPDAEPIDVAELIGEVSGLLERPLGGNMRLERMCAANCVVLADRGQLEQALVNVLINARDAMPEGGTITLTS